MTDPKALADQIERALVHRENVSNMDADFSVKQWLTILAALRAPSAETMRERCASIADSFTGYSGEGSEDRNDGVGMFARGNRNAKRRIANLIRAMPIETEQADA